MLLSRTNAAYRNGRRLHSGGGRPAVYDVAVSRIHEASLTGLRNGAILPHAAPAV
jgi:hypothetical protein